MLEKLQKRIYRIVSAPPVLENLGSLPKCSQRKFFSIGFTLVDVYLNWFHFLIVEGALLVILIDCMIFLLSFLDVNKDVYVISFFPLTDKLYLNRFLYILIFFTYFLVTPSLVVAVQLCAEWIPIIKRIYINNTQKCYKTNQISFHVTHVEDTVFILIFVSISEPFPWFKLFESFSASNFNTCNNFLYPC